MFYFILERKNAFLGYKNEKFKKSKNWNLSKDIKNWQFFYPFILGTKSQENVFYYILQRKNDFQGYKNKKFKKS